MLWPFHDNNSLFLSQRIREVCVNFVDSFGEVTSLLRPKYTSIHGDLFRSKGLTVKARLYCVPTAHKRVMFTLRTNGAFTLPNTETDTETETHRVLIN